MQRQILALLTGAILLLVAGAIVVPQLMSDGEPTPLRWSEADEVELPADEAVHTAEATNGSIERTSVATAEEATRDEARIDVVLRGRVVDTFQRGVADAKVWLDFGRGGPRGAQAGRQRRVPDAVITDAQGRFAFQGQTFRNLQVSLQVVHPSHAPRLFDKNIGEVQDDVDLGDFVLTAGGELVGRVTDLEGNGIPGAQLTLQPENANRMRFLRDRTNLLLDFVTDNNGFYRKGNLTAGDWSVSAVAKQHTEGRSPVFACEEEQVVELEDIRLGPGHEITGYVRNVQGQPIAKAEVRMRSDRRQRTARGDGGRAAAGRDHRATTDAQGRFALDHLPGVEMALDANADGYLDYRQEQIDPALNQVLQITLQDGLRITGIAVDEDAAPVRLFALRAIRVRGLPVPGQTSDPADLVARLRSGNIDETTREQARAMIDDRRGGGGPQAGQRPGPASRDLGKPETHTEGRFDLTGLQEGVYEVHLQSPDHARFRSQEIELRLGTAPPYVTAKLDRGFYVAGVVTDTFGAPVRNARVTLRTASTNDAEVGGRRRGRGAATEAQTPGQDAEARMRAFQRQVAGALSTMDATTDADGEFVVKHVPRGTYRLLATARSLADASTEPFELQADRSGIKLQLGFLGVLAGKVLGLASNEVADARVAAVPLGGANGGPGGLFGRGGAGGGGQGNPFNSVIVAADGSYRIDNLAPGDYVVRSWIGSPQELMRELGPKFFDGSLTADVSVAAGEVALLNVAVVRSQVGVVSGSVLHNGTAGSGFQIELSRHDTGVAEPDRGGRGGGGGRGGMFANFGRSFQAAVGASGQFRIENVPAGSYRLRVQAGRRGGMLHEELVEVVANASTERSIVLVTQSLQGTVSTDDGTPAGEMNGRVSLLPGLTTLPENLGAWQRENASFDARVQSGAFRFETLKAGDYLLVLTIRGRERTTQAIVVGAGAAAQIVVPAGKVSSTPGQGPTTQPLNPNGARGR